MQVRYFAAAKAAIGVSEEDLDPRDVPTIGALIDAVTARAPGAAAVLARCSFLVDGVTTTQPRTGLDSATRVDVMPPFAGG